MKHYPRLGPSLAGLGLGILCLLNPGPLPAESPQAKSPGSSAPLDPDPDWSLRLFRKWSVRPYTASHLAAADGVVYVGTREGKLFAVGSEAGSIHWVRKLGDRITGGPMVSETGRVYAGTNRGELWSLQASNGETRWHAQLSSEIIAAPQVAAKMVFVVTADGFLWALRTADGGKRWSFNVESPKLILRSGGQPAYSDGMVFAGFANGKLVALNAADGRVKWRKAVAIPQGRTELARMVDIDAAPRVVDGMVIAAAYQGAVTALDAATGEPFWEREFSAYNDLAIHGERLYITTDQESIICLAQENGSTLWTQKALQGHGALSAPAIIGETLVVGDGEGRLSWFDLETGKLRTQLDLGPSAIHTPPLALPEGGVLALSEQGTLNRIQIQP